MNASKRTFGVVAIGAWMALFVAAEPTLGATLRVDRDVSTCTTTCDGTDWTAGKVYKYIQDALLDASDGDEIWVAEGTYYPDELSCANTCDCNADTCTSNTCVFATATAELMTFNISNPAVKLYGGFKGNETSASQRTFRCYDPAAEDYDTTSCTSKSDCGDEWNGKICAPVK